MKIVMYVLGIPCILVGSRFAGLDRALIREPSSDQPSATVVNDLVSDVQAPSIAAHGNSFPAFKAAATAVPSVEEQVTAVVVPEQSARVEATAEGVLRTMLVGAGDVVKAGQRLAVLDTRRVDADIRGAQLQTLLLESKAREARSEHAKIVAKLNRRAPLVAKRVVTTEEYHDLQMELQVAGERIKQFEAEVLTSREEEKKLQNMLADYVITAPFSGRVKRVAGHAGQFVHQGDAIVELESTTNQVRALVPTSLSAKIQGLTFYVEEADGGRIQMKIAEIHGTGTATGFQDVLFDLENAERFISNQSLAVFVGTSDNPATTEQEISASLAVH